MSILNVEKLTKSFGDVEVLKGVSFSLEEGEVLSVIGSSGGGKTTLLRCINFLETPDTGRITVEGKTAFEGDPSRVNEKQYTPFIDRNVQHSLGLVFQQFNLFPQYSVLGNLTLAPRLAAKKREDFKTAKKEIYAEIDEKALSILKATGLSEKKDNYPCQLSGGQQQRVAIARALMLSPAILCFDEPTSALDPELTGEVLKVIRELRESGHTMIIVTHELEFARRVSDKIIFMANGLIEEMGTPDEIFENPKSEKTRSFIQTDYLSAN
ncbi:MAG: amino acid ABC transporter ATP-binding protein [Clostridia bacterium]|nr:amino acid ABC transporter ATP-binding protein [Clostridia bacterium]